MDEMARKAPSLDLGSQSRGEIRAFPKVCGPRHLGDPVEVMESGRWKPGDARRDQDLSGCWLASVSRGTSHRQVG